VCQATGISTAVFCPPKGKRFLKKNSISPGYCFLYQKNTGKKTNPARWYYYTQMLVYQFLSKEANRISTEFDADARLLFGGGNYFLSSAGRCDISW
jgi:hypothetical protein